MLVCDEPFDPETGETTRSSPPASVVLLIDPWAVVLTIIAARRRV